MEAVLFTALFTIPGALTSVFYRLIAHERFVDKEKNATRQLAAYFAVSIFIAVLSLAPLGAIHHKQVTGVLSLISIVTDGWNPAIYLALSMALAFIFALIQKHCLDRLKYGARKNKRTVHQEALVWDRMINAIEWEHVYCVITKDNEVVRVGGLNSVFPSDWERDSAIGLMWSDWMTGWFMSCEEDDPMRGYLVGEYLMLNTGYSIRLYRSEPLTEYLRGINATSSPSSVAEEAEARSD